MKFLPILTILCGFNSAVLSFMPRQNVKRFHPSNPLQASVAERVLENPQWPAEWPYSDEDFHRQDESNDGIFYNQARL